MQKKIIITVGLFLFLIVGSASAGKSMQALTDWHNQQFTSISQNLGGATATGLLKLYKTTNQFGANTKGTFDQAFERLTGAEEKAVQGGIAQYEKELNDELTKTESTLNKRNFNDYKEQQTNEQTITDEVNDILSDVIGE